MVSSAISLPLDQIKAFKDKWRIEEFSLFGSVLREDFGPESDIDVLVTFDEDAPWSLLDVAEMKLELEEIFSRKVDLVEEPAIKNPYRREEILSTRQVVHVN
jgi:hypothetical protein